MGAGGQLIQTQFRGRFDDGTEATATWQAAANNNWTQLAGVPFRLRLGINVAVASAGLLTTWQYNLNGAGWNNITTSSSVVKAVASAFVANGTATTQQMVGSGIYHAGDFTDDGSCAAITLLTVEDTEMEACLQIVSADVVTGDVIQLRGANNNVAFTTYTNTPSVTVLDPPAVGGLALSGVGR